MRRCHRCRPSWKCLLRSTALVYASFTALLITRNLTTGDGPVLFGNGEDPDTIEDLVLRDGLFSREKDSMVDRGKVQKLVILTYMRSGSTLTGDLFQHQPDMFYLFEPIWYVEKFYTKGKPLTFSNGTVIPGRVGMNESLDTELYQTTSYSLEVLRHINSCNLSNIDIKVMHTAYTTFLSSRAAKHFAWCSYYQRDHKPFDLVRCVNDFILACLRSKVIVVKLIRFTMAQLQVLLEADPNVKAIHLIRDPRGCLLSQYNVGEVERISIKDHAQKVCTRIDNDLTLSQQLLRSFPNRILTVRYEDIADHPMEAAGYMYNFVGLKMTTPLKKYIWSITSAGKNESCLLCTSRNNSTKTAYKWKFKLKFDDIQTIQDQCSNVFEKMGYVKINDLSEHENENFTTKRDDYQSDLFVMRPTMFKQNNISRNRNHSRGIQ